MTWHDEQLLMATCGAEPLATDNISRRLAAVHEVLRSVALQTAMNGHSELEQDALRNIKPMKLGVKEMCQAAVELVCSTDDSGIVFLSLACFVFFYSSAVMTGE